MSESPLSVLVIEGDLETLELLRSGLTKNSFSVLAASGVEEARRLFDSKGFEFFGCVLVAHDLSEMSGVEFLHWLRGEDPTLAPMVLLPTSNKVSLSEMIRAGAYDLLDKPVVLSQIRVAVTRAIDQTRDRRAALETRHQVERIEQVHHQLIGLQEVGALPQVTFRFHPMHGVGGDFVNIYPLEAGRYLIVAGDVSGHDLKAAFVTAYFQGIVRGMIEKGATVREAFSFFNRFLTTEWKREASGVTISLSACSLLVDLNESVATVNDFGFPLPYHVTAEGKIWRWKHAESPLGWFGDLEQEEERRECQAGGSVYLWSDGIEELADRLGVSPFALVYRMLFSEEGEEEVKGIATDDLMMVRFSLQKEGVGEDRWRPFFGVVYPADQAKQVDQFQEDWTKSIRFALPTIAEESLYDILLALRESALNGMLHGAGGDPKKQVEVHLLANPEGNKVRVWVEDPGVGHGYDLTLPLEQLQTQFHDNHSGLTMLKFLAKEIRIERNGAGLMMDFDVKQETS